MRDARANGAAPSWSSEPNLDVPARRHRTGPVRVGLSGRSKQCLHPKCGVRMISEDEFDVQADAFDLNRANIQRDYVFGWLIAGLFNESPLAEQLVLKGGNALRKGYLPATRFSDDLDFSTPGGVNPEQVLAQLNEICEHVSGVAGIPFDIDRNRLAAQHVIDGSKQAFKFNLYFHDMLAGVDHLALKVRADVAEYDRLHLEPQVRNLIHPYSDADACSAAIRCIKLEEALADKLKCLLQRRYAYDLFDLVYGTFVKHDAEVDRQEVVRVFLRKTIFGGSPAAAKALLLDLPVDLLRGYWHKVTTPAPSRLAFDDAVQLLRSGLDDLFGVSAPGRGYAAAFFPSRVRNPVLEAGVGRNLLAVTYDGITRIVEPYSLTFKRRKDGVGQEYLYVWDRTGGRSGPGIKAFIHSKITAIRVLDESFEPRFSIELTKAGDVHTAGRFTASRSTSRVGGRSRQQGPQFVVECSYCGKRFKRTKPSTRINKHKDPNGWPCSGRTGYRVR